MNYKTAIASAYYQSFGMRLKGRISALEVEQTLDWLQIRRCIVRTPQGVYEAHSTNGGKWVVPLPSIIDWDTLQGYEQMVGDNMG